MKNQSKGPKSGWTITSSTNTSFFITQAKKNVGKYQKRLEELEQKLRERTEKKRREINENDEEAEGLLKAHENEKMKDQVKLGIVEKEF